MPFLTILTRVHPARPKCLMRNIKSVEMQTDGDLHHLLLRPEVEPNDVIKVGPLIHYAAARIQGRYIMQLPDDDQLRSPEFVKNLRAITESESADMVIFRMEIGQWVCPPDDKWLARCIEGGYIAGQNVIVKREIYDGASHEWLRPEYGADFYYIQTAFGLSKKVVWWDYVGTESQWITRVAPGTSEESIILRPTCI